MCIEQFFNLVNFFLSEYFLFLNEDKVKSPCDDFLKNSLEKINVHVSFSNESRPWK